MRNEDPSAPSRAGQEACPGITPESVAQAETVLADIDALIAEIERAPAGGEALDSRIHFGFRVAMEHCPDVAALLFREGVSWSTVKQALDAQIPPFTTSLDAALEGEDITFVVHAARERKWGAMQRTRRGEEVLVWAATEPLARRLAAIKAWRTQFAHALEQTRLLAEAEDKKQTERTAPAEAVPNARREATMETDNSGAAKERKDWEVLF